MTRAFEIGEEVSALIGNDVFKFRCSSTHTEKIENK